jgi:hypothetical protein
MGDFLRRNPLTLALAALAVVLAVVLGLEWTLGGPPAVPASVKPVLPADSRLMPPLVAVAPEQAYPETAARPLFTPTRRPAPEAVATQQPAFQRGQFVLLGVIMAGNTRTAMLREKSNGRLHRVEAGRDLNGIKVAQIDRDSVTLSQGTENETLPLSVQRPGNAPAPGTPGAAAMAQPPQPTGAAMTQGPFGGPPPTAAPGGAQGMQGFGNAAPPLPGFMQNTGPAGAGGMPMQAAPNTPGAPVPAPPNATAVPTPESALTPEEILARRRARRAQQTQ